MRLVEAHKRREQIRDVLKVAEDYATHITDPHNQEHMHRLISGEEPLSKEQTRIEYFFATTPSSSKPPFEGFLVPAIEVGSSASRRLEIQHKVVFPDMEGAFTPSIKVNIDGDYVQAEFSNSTPQITKRYVSFEAIQKCPVIVASQKSWVKELWMLTWADEYNGPTLIDPEKMLNVEPYFTFRAFHPLMMPTPIEIIDASEIDKDEANTAPNLPGFFRKYLVMMLLSEFWERQNYTHENKNDNLKKLGLVPDKASYRSFATDWRRVGCVTYSSDGFTVSEMHSQKNKSVKKS